MFGGSTPSLRYIISIIHSTQHIFFIFITCFGVFTIQENVLSAALLLLLQKHCEGNKQTALCWGGKKSTESPQMDSGMLEAAEVQTRAWDFESLLHRIRLVCLAGCDFEWQ